MAMLVDAPHQIVCHPDVERSVALTRHDVDVVGPGAIVARAAARLIPIVTPANAGVPGERRSGRPGSRIALALARLARMRVRARRGGCADAAAGRSELCSGKGD